jgi:hypothetical protein
MSLVTTGAETWAPHTHRHHHAAGTTWLFGPEGPANVTGPDPVTAQPRIGDFEFLFWSAAGAQGGGLTYPGGELTPMPTPVFPADAHSGSLIAWYIDRGGNGPPPPPNLLVDAFSATDGDWIDWDQSNDPFVVTSGARGAPPDGDDEVVTEDAPASVRAAQWFPGTGLRFDRWLVLSGGAQVAPGADEVTEAQGGSGIAVAVYREPDWRVPDVPVAYDPWWWLKNSPVEIAKVIAQHQSEVGQITTLIDFSSSVSNRRTRAMLQRGMYETLIATAQRHLKADEELIAEGEH